MARITINLQTELAAVAKAKAAADRRSVSSYLLKLIEADLGAADHVVTAASELRALGADPLMALRDKIAEVQRDQFLSPNHDERTTPNLPAPSPVSQPHLSHPPAPSRRLASRAASRPALRVG